MVLPGNEQADALTYPWFVLHSRQKLVFPPSGASFLVRDALKISTECPEYLLPNLLKNFTKKRPEFVNIGHLGAHQCWVCAVQGQFLLFIVIKKNFSSSLLSG